MESGLFYTIIIGSRLLYRRLEILQSELEKLGAGIKHAVVDLLCQRVDAILLCIYPFLGLIINTISQRKSPSLCF